MHIYIGSEQRDTYLNKCGVSLDNFEVDASQCYFFLKRRLVKAEIIIWKQPVFLPLNSKKIMINNLRLKINDYCLAM